MRIATTLVFIFATFSSFCGQREVLSPQARFALACVQGDSALVKELMANGPLYIDAVNGKIGPCLSSASYGGHKEIVELMLEKGANINIRDEKGTTPLINAVVGNKPEIVKLLLDHGADANIIIPNEKGEITDITALKIARVKGYSEIIKLLEN